MKFLRLPLSTLLLIVAMCSAQAAGEDQVTAQVRDFYQWYLPLLNGNGQDKEILQKHRKEMSRYVAANLLAKIARIRSDSQEGDYFVKSLDFDKEWTKNMKVSNVKIDAKGRASAEVVLSGGTAAKVSVKAVLVSEGGTYKISAVENLPVWGDMASAEIKAFYSQYVHYRIYATADEAMTGHEGSIRERFTKEGYQRATAKGAADAKVDYILQSTDLDPQWEEHVEIKSAEITPDGTHGTVEVLLAGEKVPNAHLKVSVKQEKQVFKIDGVEKLAN